MSQCILCLNASLEVDYFNLRQNISTTMLLKDSISQYFPFVKLDNEEGMVVETSQSCCKQCFDDLLNFHSFFERIKFKHFLSDEQKNELNETPVAVTAKIQETLNMETSDESKSKRTRRPTKLNLDELIVENKTAGQLKTRQRTLPLVEDRTDLMPSKIYRRRTSADEKRISDTIDMQCDLCKTTLKSFSHALSHHKEFHKQTGYLICCGKKFRQRTTLVDHLDVHANPKAFECKICQKSFPGLSNLKWHLQFIHFATSYQCDICGKFRKTKRSIKSHIDSHINNLSQDKLKNLCQMCNKICNNELSLKLHMKNCHNPNRDTFCCEICGKTLMSKLSLREHITNTHSSNVTKAPCPICGHFIKNQSSMKKHLSRHKYDTNNVITCKQCEKVCTTKAALSSHMKMKHLLQRNLPCRFCEKKFKQKISLIEHEATHTHTILYSCLWCSATFKFGANFRAHRKTAHPDQYEKIKPSWLRPT